MPRTPPPDDTASVATDPVEPPPGSDPKGGDGGIVLGALESIDDQGVATGWAGDPTHPARPVEVHFYVDGPVGSGTLAGTVQANQHGRHDVLLGYSWVIPSQFRDGTPHSLYVYGVDPSARKAEPPLLSGSPQDFTL